MSQSLMFTRGFVDALCLADLLNDPKLVNDPEMVFPFVIAAGHSMIFIAPPKLGKTTFAAFVCSLISAGGKFGQQNVGQGPILWLSFEESLGSIVRRFRDMGAKAEFIGLRRSWTSGEHVQQVKSVLLAQPAQPRLVIIDTLASFGSGHVTSENDAAQMTRLVQPITDLAHETGVAIVMLHHANRSNGTYRGSSALAGSVDMLCEMHPVAGNENGRLLKFSGRIHLDPVSIAYDHDSRSFSMCDGATDGEKPAWTVSSTDTKLKRGIMETLGASSGMTKSAIYQTTGVRKATASAAVAELIEAGHMQPHAETKSLWIVGRPLGGK